MAKISRIEARLVTIPPLKTRSDAIQSFVAQETPILTIYDDEGVSGTGYSYTIGTGGSSVMALLEDHLLPDLLGRDTRRVEQIWHDLYFGTHATTVGPITTLALAAIDVALWDLNCRRNGIPLHLAAGGAHGSIPVYSTESGWLNMSEKELVHEAKQDIKRGFTATKIKVGKPSIYEDVCRLSAIRQAVGPDFQIMIDANQGLTLPDALRRARAFEALNLTWIEEPLPADDVLQHKQLAAHTSTPIAIGESLYSLSQFKDYLHSQACSIVQVDVARIGGITPWLKVAHLAQAFNVPVSPHFLMELHLPLVCAVPNGRWLEYIPQLTPITKSSVSIKEGHAYPSAVAGHGIEWDWEAIEQVLTAKIEL
ncbi:mandelate racemase/muconate lactonizing enzyme family protein [Flexibacterium corallicola]|uniref:mandelate racemase/muconate lactonizing enzyme family protein n=1 Tax=Flexibacterium corallicola TaxID=3037259 RepID=UPI00286F3C88|nr:mandelate racemase/muconate lactonizing enzyme family protein [Pseudovibrio sp. M1P-2-3]